MAGGRIAAPSTWAAGAALTALLSVSASPTISAILAEADDKQIGSCAKFADNNSDFRSYSAMCSVASRLANRSDLAMPSGFPGTAAGRAMHMVIERIEFAPGVASCRPNIAARTGPSRFEVG
jgi:hypothetical protein